jgi:gamma-glutamylcyclotransferase (GGCT)/AIG2-like uncharacterized protein YtfP
MNKLINSVSIYDFDFYDEIDDWVNPSYHFDKVHYIFVYGTMKQGFRNYNRIKSRYSTYVGNFVTKKKYHMMVRETGIGYIAPVAIEGGDFRISGEIYKTKGPNLQIMDIAEGHPNIYVRRKISIKGYPHNVWMYLYNPEQLDYFYDNHRIQFCENKKALEFLNEK